jgi:hypothetical protein
MSRGEELRAKFKAKGQAIAAQMNSPAGRFSSDLFAFLHTEFDCFVDAAFTERMFQKFTADAPADQAAWFQHEVKSLFRSATVPPKWVHEPDWCYHDGMPMEFLHQFTDEHGTSFYVFRGRRPSSLGGPDSWQAIYKMSAQDSECRIILRENLIA